jgi:hypothetical protein
MGARQDKIEQQLITDIQSKDDKIVIDCIAKIKSKGTAVLIPHLLELWFKSTDEVEIAVTDLLYSLKDPDVIPALMHELEKTKTPGKREKIISIFWNAGLEPKDHLATFVNCAITGDFMEAVEALTVIENMEPPFPEDQLMDGLLMLKEYFSANPTGDKVTIIRSIATFMQYADETQLDG